MKRKGFTLIEMIVVIAIIGVLAAILIPAMIGYISKSRIMAANTAARDLNTAISISILEMVQKDFATHKLNADYSYTQNDIVNAPDVTLNTLDKEDTDDMESVILASIHEYFTSTTTLDAVSFHLSGGTCTAIGVMSRGYPGSFPIAISEDDFHQHETWTADDALDYAKNK